MSERLIKASLLTETDGVYLAHVPHVLYEIDGEIVKIANYNGEDIQVADVYSIIPISTASIIDQYEGSTGIGTLTVAEIKRLDDELTKALVKAHKE